MTRRRVVQHLLDAFKERRLVNPQDIIDLPRMTRRKLLRPQVRPPQIRTIKRRIDIHIRLHLARDQIRPRHNSRGCLVPERKPDIVTFHQLRIRIVAQCDAIEHFLCQILLVRHISRDGDGRERRRDGDVRGFGVDEEVDVGAEVFGEGGLELVEVEVHVAAHDDEFFGGGGEGAVEADGGGDVGQGALDWRRR